MFQASEGNTTIYSNTISIDCNNQEMNETRCTFKNRANNTTTATLRMPIINSKFSIKHQHINKLNRAFTVLVNLA